MCFTWQREASETDWDNYLLKHEVISDQIMPHMHKSAWSFKASN